MGATQPNKTLGALKQRVVDHASWKISCLRARGGKPQVHHDLQYVATLSFLWKRERAFRSIGEGRAHCISASLSQRLVKNGTSLISCCQQTRRAASPRSENQNYKRVESHPEKLYDLKKKKKTFLMSKFSVVKHKKKHNGRIFFFCSYKLSSS